MMKASIPLRLKRHPWPTSGHTNSFERNNVSLIFASKVLHQQAEYIESDPYSSAFRPPGSPAKPQERWNSRHGPLAQQENYELDSSMWFLRFLEGLHRKAPACFEGADKSLLQRAVKNVVDTVDTEMDHSTRSHYRNSEVTNSQLRMKGRIGLTWSGSRPSDDHQQLAYLIPANLFAAAILKKAAPVAQGSLGDVELADRMVTISGEMKSGVRKWGTKDTKEFGRVYCYEVDGLGQCLLRDDANLPSLISIPIMDPDGTSYDKDIYENTRNYSLSSQNPFYFKGKYGEGLGSEHTGHGVIWPLGLLARAWTARSIEEEAQQLHLLTYSLVERRKLLQKNVRVSRHGSFHPSFLQLSQETTPEESRHEAPHFIMLHEGYEVGDPTCWSRDDFGWANSFFADTMRNKFGFLWEVGATPPVAEDSATFCAFEDQECSLKHDEGNSFLALFRNIDRDPVCVAFGSRFNRQWNVARIRHGDSVKCSQRVFGNPEPNLPKQCWKVQCDHKYWKAYEPFREI